MRRNSERSVERSSATPVGCSTMRASVSPAGDQRLRLQLRHGLDRCVGVDEFDLDGAPVAAHEQELIALRKTMLDHRRRERREEVPVDRALERPRAHRRAKTLCPAGSRVRTTPIRRPIPDACSPRRSSTRASSLREDAAHELTGQRSKDDDRIEPVHELGAKRLLHGPEDLILRKRAGCRPEARTETLFDCRPQVRRQNDDAVPEIDDLPRRIRQPSVVEHLEEQVPDVRMGLFELVEQDD